MQILIVEDHAGICFALEMFLELEGHVAQSVDRGEAALKVLESQAFDLILLDLNTNGMTAGEFMAHLNSLVQAQKRPRPAVGLVSGSVHIEAEARRLGVDFLVRKPFEHEDLLAHLRRLPPTGLVQSVDTQVPGSRFR